MDGLPGTNNGQATMISEKITPLKKMVGPLAPTRYRNRNGGFGPEHLLLAGLLSTLLTVLLMLYGAQVAKTLLGNGAAKDTLDRSRGERFWF